MNRQIQPNVKTYLPALILYIIAVLLPSCETFYKIAGTSQSSASQIYSSIDSLNKLDKYFILRNREYAYHLNIIELGNQQDTIFCLLDILPEDHKLHLTKGKNGTMRLDGKDTTRAVLNEVHIYISWDSTILSSNYALPLDRVKKIEVIELDKQRTDKSKAAGITISVIVAIFTLVAFTLNALVQSFY